jgi:hypothetical protein
MTDSEEEGRRRDEGNLCLHTQNEYACPHNCRSAETGGERAKRERSRKGREKREQREKWEEESTRERGDRVEIECGRERDIIKIEVNLASPLAFGHYLMTPDHHCPT